MIMDDYGCYRGIEITSTILDEHISLFTSNDLSNYGTINNLRKSGFGEIQPEIPNFFLFELNFFGGKYIQFMYDGLYSAANYGRHNIFIYKDLLGSNHSILFDFIHKIMKFEKLA